MADDAKKPPLKLISGMKRRPPAPTELTVEQATIWKETVDRMPADWFPTETHPLLIQYCRHVSEARFIASKIAIVRADASKVSVERYELLLRLQDRESRAIATIATKLRLTPQSRYTPTRAETSQRRDGGDAWRDPEAAYFDREGA